MMIKKPMILSDEEVIVIKQRLLELQSVDINKGLCVCAYKGLLYFLSIKLSTIECIEIPSTINDDFYNVDTVNENAENEHKYYFWKPEVWKEQVELNAWLDDNFEILMMAGEANISDGNNKIAMIAKITMQTLIKDFQNRFPKKSFLEFCAIMETRSAMERK